MGQPADQAGDTVAAPGSALAPSPSALAAINDLSVAIVAAWTSRPWIVLVSIDKFSLSQFSTDFSSAILRSSSSGFREGVSPLFIPAGPANPAKA